MPSIICPACDAIFDGRPHGHWIWCTGCGQPIDAATVIGAGRFRGFGEDRVLEAFARPGRTAGVNLPMAG